MEIIETIITFLTAVALLITSMSLMSKGLRKISGRGVKKLFKKTKNNRFANIGMGIGVTAIIQSSAATCVMVLGFINAGVMSVFQGVSIMIGAYIGTTATGLLVSLSSFNFSIYLTLLAFIGVILLFIKNNKVKNIGTILTGLGLMFFSLKIISDTFKTDVLTNACTTIFSTINNPILLLLVGVVLTALIQSSSATTSLVIVAVGSGAIPFASALYIALGATIGTCITTVLASLDSNVKARRATLISVFIKVLTGVAGLCVLWPFEATIAGFFENSFATKQLGVAMFTLIFNILFMGAILPLVKPFERLAKKAIKDKDKINMKRHLLYIDKRLLVTPDVALMQTKSEILNMYDLAYKNFKLGYSQMFNYDPHLNNSITETEDIIDYINKEITNYLISLSSTLTQEQETILGGYFHVINDIERIGDHSFNFLESAKSIYEKELSFSDIAKNEFNSMYDVINQMFIETRSVFESESKARLVKIHGLEQRTDDLKLDLSSAHYERISKNQCKIELSPFYSTFISELERVADHLTNIAYSIIDPTGD